MKFSPLYLGILLVSTFQVNAQVLTIDHIIEISLKHSPDIEIQRLNFKSSQEHKKIAESAYLPHLDLSIEGGKQYSTFKEQDTYETDILRGGLGASQLLYDFGKTAGRVRGAEETSLALEAEIQQSISDKIFLLKQAYYDILKSKSIIQVQIKNVKLQKQQLHRAKKYLESGIKTIIDVSDAQVQVQRAILDLNNARYALELKHAVLEEEMGYIPYEGEYTLYNKLLPKKGLSASLPKVKSSLATLERYAYKHRYVLSASKYSVHVAKADVQTAQGDYFPTLSLNGNYNRQEVDSKLIGTTPQSQGEVSINMRWNIFSGYQTNAVTQEAKIAVLKASSQVQNIKLAIKREVLESHISLRQSKDSVSLSESISKASLAKYEQAEKRYANELSDYIELQDAQQDYIRSLSDMVNAYYDYFIALAKLDHAIGK